MTSTADARLTTGADIQTVPVPGFISPMEMRSDAMMESGTWGVSSGHLGSASQWTKFTVQ